MKVRDWVTKGFAIIIILAVFTALAGPAMAKGSKRVLIGFKKNSVHRNRERRGRFVRDRGGKVHHSFKLIRAISANMSDQAISRMRGRADIAYVEEDTIMHAIGQSTPWGVNRVNAPTAWGTSRGAGVDVAILDTGIDYNHPDLIGSLARGGGVNFSGFSNDGRTEASYWDDGHGHGTHTAGIVAAEDNGIGVVGVAPGANLWAVKVLSNGGSGYTSDIIQGLEWCANNGIEVASMSLGGIYNQSLENACNEAYAAGVLLVAAAGNDYGGEVIYPAACESVIAVSATDSNNGIASFSSIGPEVELAAPGASIYSTYKGGGYTYMSGTSMACPHVSGVAALVFASSGSSAAGVRQTMNNTAVDIGLSSYQQGNGLVDAANAVGGTTTPSPPISDLSGSPTSGSAALNVGFTDQSTGNVTSWSWNFGDGGTSGQRNPSHTYQNNGNYTVRLTVTGPGGSDTCTYTNYVTVAAPTPPSALFSGSPTSGEALLAVNFTDESTGDITSWAWNFGDGGTSSQRNPSHTYQNAGSYTVSLTLEGPGGSDTCTYIDYVQVTAPQAPVADFSGSPISGGAPLTVSFTDRSTGSIDSWSWNFGDGGTSSQRDPSHTYQNAGSYTVSLTVTGPGGSDIWTETNYITVSPAEQLSLNVMDIELKAKYKGSRKWQVKATVLVVDSNGKPVSGATVSGFWSGAYGGSELRNTDRKGKSTFKTRWMNKRGSITFTVSKVSKSGYESASNSGSSATITYGQ